LTQAYRNIFPHTNASILGVTMLIISLSMYCDRLTVHPFLGNG
jgi:hypothetical protein